MAFAIMRCKKLKGMGSVAGAIKHCFRERETFNADPARTPIRSLERDRDNDLSM